MEKFLWLLDIEKAFKGFNYIYYVKEINSEVQDDDFKTMMNQIATLSKLIQKY